MTACPTETPVMWGWSHTPYLGGVIEGNILEDSEGGGVLGLEHDRRSVKSNTGRTYMAVQFRQNVVRWSEPFLRSRRDGRRTPAAGGCDARDTRRPTTPASWWCPRRGTGSKSRRRGVPVQRC